MYRLLASAVLVLAVTSAQAAPLKVFVLSGQSNMVGAGHPNDMPDTLEQPQTDVRYSFRVSSGANVWQSPGWTDLQLWHDGNRGVYGPEITFGRTMADALGEEIAIIKVARNGTGLAGYWNPSATGQGWDSLTDHVSSALARLGQPYEVAGFVWVQGETDSQNQAHAEAYAENLTGLYDAIAGEWGTVPFVQAQLHASLALGTWPHRDTVRAEKASWTLAQTNAALVGVDDLTLLPDMTHYTGVSQQILGERLADAMLTLIPEPASLSMLAGCLILLRRR